MSLKKQTSYLTVFTLVCAAVLTMIMTSPVLAQDKVCMTLPPGEAAYAAQMSLAFYYTPYNDKVSSSKTGTFPIGKTECITIKDVIPAGPAPLRVAAELHVLAGLKIVCEPIPYDPKTTGTINYIGRGTTMMPSCRLQ